MCVLLMGMQENLLISKVICEESQAGNQQRSVQLDEGVCFDGLPGEVVVKSDVVVQPDEIGNSS